MNNLPTEPWDPLGDYFVKDLVRDLDLPHHRTYLDATTSGVPRERALVLYSGSESPRYWHYWLRLQIHHKIVEGLLSHTDLANMRMFIG